MVRPSKDDPCFLNHENKPENDIAPFCEDNTRKSKEPGRDHNPKSDPETNSGLGHKAIVSKNGGSRNHSGTINSMRDFLLKHSYLVVWVSALAVIGSLAALIIQLNGVFVGGPGEPIALRTNGSSGVARPSGPPPPPSVTFTIQKSKNGNSFFVQWANLPDGTIALNIYRGKTGTDPKLWTLWKTIHLSPGDLLNGSAQIAIGQATEAGFSFRLEAIGSGTPILWESSSTVPTVTTSTGPGILPPLPPPTPPPTPAPSSSSQPPPPNPVNPPSSTPPGGGPSPSSSQQNPSGTPYYSPQVQISGYGTDHSGNFWVQHVEGKIQLGWQSLSQQVTSIAILRSESESGPWTTILTQQNPDTGSSYSIQIVDDTVGTPFYYEASATQSDGVTLLYGPVYLAPSQ